MRKCFKTAMVLGMMILAVKAVFAEEPVLAPNAIEGLFFQEVTVASKKAESMYESPGIISVITAEEIRKLPYETLQDIIKTIPGVTISESFFGYASVSFRGVKETHYNNRTLLLLNGHPVREVVQAQYYLETIPINSIDKIEIIRGPGSVMYGTNAFSGVINVVTKHKVNVTDAAARGGSKTTEDGNFTLGRTYANGINFLGAASLHQSDGYNAIVKDESGVTQQMGVYPGDPKAYQNNFYNLFGNFGWEDFNFDVFYFHQDKDKFGITPAHATTGTTQNDGGGVTANYSKEIQKGLNVSSTAYYSRFFQKNFLNLFPPSSSGTPINMKNAGDQAGIDVDGRMEFKVLQKMAVSAGLSFIQQYTEPYEWINAVTLQISPYSSFLRDYNTNDFSAYGQLEIVPVKQLKILGGVRYNKNKDYGATIVPRGSLVYTALDNLFIKALYGSAYRNPSFFEKYVNTQNVLYGDPNLKPEKINTAEIGADWVLAQTMLRLSIFNLDSNDMISRVRTYFNGDIPDVCGLEIRSASTAPTRATPGYGNTQGQVINGVEFEIKSEPLGDLLAINFNCSYKEGKEKADWSPIQFLDQIVVNLVLSNKIIGFTNTVSVGYVGQRKGNIDPSVAAPGFVPNQEVSTPAYTLVNLKSSYAIDKHVDISLIVMNIGEQKVLYPEYVRRRIDAIPGDNGRNVFGQIDYRF